MRLDIVALFFNNQNIEYDHYGPLKNHKVVFPTILGDHPLRVTRLGKYLRINLRKGMQWNKMKREEDQSQRRYYVVQHLPNVPTHSWLHRSLLRSMDGNTKKNCNSLHK